jgi:drug/metabolite transporter (DMT)-like permease
MSLVVAVPCGVASSIVYGTSIVVQHRTAQQHAGDSGDASASGLLQMIRNPIWLLAIAGDLVGFLLQIAALSTGPVVIVQPLVVLMLPVSLGVSYLLGGHRPRMGDYLGVLAVLGGLGVFLAVVGVPGAGHVPHPRFIAVAVVIVLGVGVVLVAVVTGRSKVLRGAMYGAVAGAFFGTLAVLVDAASDRLGDGGAHALLETPRGLVPLAGAVLCGTSGIVLTQLSFQVGALGATLPANLATDPMTGVLLGAVLLHEHIPLSAGHLVLYVFCLAAVLGGAIRLADPAVGPLEPDPVPAPPDAEPAEAQDRPPAP